MVAVVVEATAVAEVVTEEAEVVEDTLLGTLTDDPLPPRETTTTDEVVATKAMSLDETTTEGTSLEGMSHEGKNPEGMTTEGMTDLPGETMTETGVLVETTESDTIVLLQPKPVAGLRKY